MEALLFIGGVCWLLFWLVPKILEFLKPPAQSSTSTPSPLAGQPQPSPRTTYRPQPPKKKPKIEFPPSPSPTPSQPPDLKDLHDAFTGTPLNPALGLYQCTNCQVYYHSESLAVLREANAGRCVACGSTRLTARSVQEAGAGRDHDPDVVTLANFTSHFNRVVNFEGLVHELKVSKSGMDYALMFEQASWKRGLKLVFFRRSIADVGGVVLSVGAVDFLSSRT
jgi:hypothetical protein